MAVFRFDALVSLALATTTDALSTLSTSGTMNSRVGSNPSHKAPPRPPVRPLCNLVTAKPEQICRILAAGEARPSIAKAVERRRRESIVWS